MLAATFGLNTHRGAIWALGLLVATAAIAGPQAPIARICALAGAIAREPDRFAPAETRNGATACVRYEVGGALWQAQAGFPHVMWVALPMLRAARSRHVPETFARLAGHPVIALIVGRGMSGGLLAHGYQANRVLALDAVGVMVHAMGKDAAARVTRRTVAQLDALAETILPLAYDIRTFARLGLVHGLIAGVDAEAPSADDIETVRAALIAAIADARSGPRDLSHRLASAGARENRAASIRVRDLLAAQWT